MRFAMHVIRRTCSAIGLFVLWAVFQPGPLAGSTDWMYKGKIGISTHYLARSVSSLECLANRFDAQKVASQAESAGASWFLFTIHHQTWLMMAPNSAFDRIIGNTRRTSERDIPLELHEKLKAKNIRLMLYVNLRLDPASAAPDYVREAMGGWPPTARLIDNLSEVYREFSLRYGERISGWWVDAAGLPGYRRAPHRASWFNQIASALRAGNPDAIVAFNPGVRVKRYINSDFTAGETKDLSFMPNARWLDGAQWHGFVFLGGWWSASGTRFDDRDLIDYSRRVLNHGGVLTFDVGTLGITIASRGAAPERTAHAGYIDPAQVRQIRAVSKAVRLREVDEEREGPPIINSETVAYHPQCL